MNKISWFAMCCLLSVVTQAKAEVIDFEELTTFTGPSPLGGGSFYNGNSGNVSNSNGWNSGSAHFANSYTYIDDGVNPPFDFWGGWAYSNVVNTTSGGFMNQYAAFAGGGSNGAGGVDVGGNYAMAFTGSITDSSGNPLEFATTNFASLSQLVSVDITNATYAALYARDGNDGGFSDPDFIRFRDGDFLRLIVSGYDGDNGTGNLTGQRTFDLIDYKGAGAADDFILSNWETLDLSTFGLTKSLTFATTSSQIGSFNGTFFSFTPGYVAVDNLVTAVPEPASLAMLCVAGAGGYWLRRRRANKS